MQGRVLGSATNGAELVKCKDDSYIWKCNNKTYYFVCQYQKNEKNYQMTTGYLMVSWMPIMFCAVFYTLILEVLWLSAASLTKAMPWVLHRCEFAVSWDQVSAACTYSGCRTSMRPGTLPLYRHCCQHCTSSSQKEAWCSFLYNVREYASERIRYVSKFVPMNVNKWFYNGIHTFIFL